MARIGLLGLWAHRGAGVVNRTLYQALTDLGHDVYVFARMGVVWGQPIQESTGMWAVPHLHQHPRYEVDPSTLKSWAQFHRLEAVVFNEEYEFALPMVLQQAGIRTIGYIDFLAASQRPLLKFFDQLWTATQRTRRIFDDWKKAEQTTYIGWGVPDGMIGVHAGESPRFDLFHNAGWLGINRRKGTDSLLAAMELMGDEPIEALMHSQLPLAQAQHIMGRDSLPPHVVWHDETEPPPGLYHHGRVVVQPSKLEGLGLTLVEAMAAGRPVITTDAPPMHEFVTDATGWLVPVDHYVARGDGILFPEAFVQPSALAKVLQEALAASDELIAEKGQQTLGRAREMFDWQQFTGRIASGLERLGM